MKKILFVLSFFLLLYTPYIVEAEEVYNIIDEVESPTGYDAKQTAQDAISGKLSVTFSGIIQGLASLFIGGIQENLPEIIKLTVVAVMSGLVLNLGIDKDEIGVIAFVAIVSAISIKTFSYTLNITLETIDALFLFISALMTPVATAASTGATTMGAAAVTTFVSMQVFIYICKTVLLPLVSVIAAFSLCDKFGRTAYLKGINTILKQILKWSTGLMITVYGVVVGMQTQTAASFDSLAGKSIKYAIGSFVPVVGSALSDSLETVITSAKAVTNALGVAGILGVGYICAVPLINICVISLSFKLAAAIASVTSEKRVSAVISEISESIGRVALILMSVAIMFIISLAMLCSFGGR